MADAGRRDVRSRRLLPAELIEGQEVEALFMKVRLPWVLGPTTGGTVEGTLPQGDIWTQWCPGRPKAQDRWIHTRASAILL